MFGFNYFHNLINNITTDNIDIFHFIYIDSFDSNTYRYNLQVS